MIDIYLENISKAYLTENIINNVTFHVNESDKVGLVGLNGSGKTTLLNIITGKIDYDDGILHVRKNKKIAYLEQLKDTYDDMQIIELGKIAFSEIINLEKKLDKLIKDISALSFFPSELELAINEYSIAKDNFEKLDGYSYNSKIKGVFNGLGFNESDLYRKVIELSGGEKNKLMLGLLLLKNAEILILDEPTNHLDIDSIQWLEKYLSDSKSTIILVSHDRYFLDKIVNKIFFINEGTLTTYKGNYSDFIAKRRNEIQEIQKKFMLQEKEISRQQDIIKKFLDNGRDKKVKQAKSREKTLKKTTLIENPNELSNNFNLSFPITNHSGSEVLKIDKSRKSFGEKFIFKNISFNIYRQEKIGLIGPNGIGKTTLLKIITGLDSEYSGNITLGHNVEIGYFDQNITQMDKNNTVIEELWNNYPEMEHSRIRGYLSAFLFSKTDISKKISALSGGEKNRLSLLKLMLKKSNFLILDEPTNHLDIDSKEVLESAIKLFEGTVLIVTHDRYFLNKTVNKIIELSANNAEIFHGDYDYYKEKKNMIYSPELEIINKTKLKEQRKKENELNNEKKEINAKIKLIENSILEKEVYMSTLEDKLCQPEVFSNHLKSKELSEELEKTKEELEIFYEQLIDISI